MKIKSTFLVKPHSKVRLSRLPTDAHPGYKDESATTDALDTLRAQISGLQEKLYAAQQKSVLIVLQGMDTAGKDGTIRHIFQGVNPQGCDVASFKVPTPLEARHDFLWRCHAQAPASGMIGVFNRSHYEDALWPRVHGKLSGKQARAHLDEINDWEKMLAANGTVILKFFLHISQEEQTRRLQSRIDSKDKHWKLSPADFAERAFWPEYMEAYEEVLSQSSRKHAPWFVIPADNKWFLRVAVAQILADAMQGMELKYPPPAFSAKEFEAMKASLAPHAKKFRAPVKTGA